MAAPSLPTAALPPALDTAVRPGLAGTRGWDVWSTADTQKALAEKH